MQKQDDPANSRSCQYFIFANKKDQIITKTIRVIVLIEAINNERVGFGNYNIKDNIYYANKFSKKKLEFIDLLPNDDSI